MPNENEACEDPNMEIKTENETEHGEGGKKSLNQIWEKDQLITTPESQKGCYPSIGICKWTCTPKILEM